jgi:hypothetical protein
MTARVQRPGQTEHIARPEDALDMLAAALAAPPKSKLRQSYLEGALFAYYLGRVNQRHFGERGDRRGSPRGKRGARHDDHDALVLMQGLSKVYGEIRPHVLARLAVDTGRVDMRGAQRATVERRLAERWKHSVEIIS